MDTVCYNNLVNHKFNNCQMHICRKNADFVEPTYFQNLSYSKNDWVQNSNSITYNAYPYNV